MIEKILVSENFIKSYKSLPIKVKKFAQKKEEIFKQNPHDSKLKTHKLKGKLSDNWAFSINYSYRILFRFINNEEVMFLDIGTHQIYK